jgi:hypothetical protein
MAIEAQHSLNEPGMKGRSIVLGGRWLTHILAAKGLDGGDRVLAKSVAERLIHALRMQAKRGKIAIAGKERGAIG